MKSLQTQALPARRQTGFSLLEVLVSIVIFSFGLLGLAGLQAASLKVSREAQLQSTAVLLAREYAELLRNNNQLSALAGTGNPYLIATADEPETASACLGATLCDSAEVAAWDRNDWLERVGGSLPGAVVRVCFDAQPFVTGTGSDAGLAKLFSAGCTDTGDTVMIKIGWQEITGTATASAGGGGTYQRTISDALRPSIVLPVSPGGPVLPVAGGAPPSGG